MKAFRSIDAPESTDDSSEIDEDDSTSHVRPGSVRDRLAYYFAREGAVEFQYKKIGRPLYFPS